MKLIGENFSRNGHNTFKGMVKAVEDDGSYTGWADIVNIYSRKEKLKLIENLVDDLSLGSDKARAMVNNLTKELESQAQSAEVLPDEEDGKKSQSTQLVDLAKDCELWHDPEGTPFVSIHVEGHRETWGTHTKSFRTWLSHQYYLQEGKSPGNQAVYDALAVLDGKAVFEGAEHQVYVRVAEVENTIYLDLANENWQVVKITANGWGIVEEAPVRFRRSHGMQPLPKPVGGGTLNPLRALLNIADDSEDEWSLFSGCLIQALRGRGPYPVLVIYGEHGSAKSTASRVFRRLIDPNKADLRSPPKDERDMMIQAGNGWIIAYDNLSNLPEWLSNGLCRLSTGGGMGTRQLYSDGEEKIFEGQRPIVLNGIEEISHRPDLMDRAVILILRAISQTKRKTERQFWRDFNAIHGEILGSLLDGVVTGLNNVETVRLEELPRMADFAIWATAAETGLGFEAGTFITAYQANRDQANEATLEASIVATYVLQFIETERDWTGTFTDLLAELDLIADEKHRKHKSWPTRPNVLSSRIRALAPNLRAAGVEVTQGRVKGKSRVRLQIIEIESADKNKAGKDRHPRPDRHPFRPSSSGGSGSSGGSDESGRYSSICLSCHQTIPEEEVYEYVDDGVICQSCGDEK